MSDPPEASEPTSPPGGGPPAPLTPDAVAAVLADFRAWIAAATPPPSDPPAAPPAAGVDLFTLVGQFTALRHEVNLQTKAARAAVEQNAEALRQLEAAREAAEDAGAAGAGGASDEALRPLVKAFVDIADALTLSLRQMEKLRDAVEPVLADLEPAPGPPAPAPVPGPPPGFFARLFGGRPPAPAPVPGPPPARGKAGVGRLRQLVASAADGYAMSLRRVGRVLPTLDLEPLPCVGGPFDPELMEVVEVVGGTGEPAGTVVEEVRPGYQWRGKPFRFAQVKVAR